MRRLIMGILAPAVLLVSACGGSSTQQPATTAATGTSTGQTADPSVPDDSASTPVATARPEHGIVVASEYDGIIEIGMIDPMGGSYAVENTFEVGDFAKGPNEPDVTSAVGFSMVVSPDRNRVMAQRNVNGDFHTGWITSDGEFVDITAATLGERTDFSGPVSSRGLGFNRQGNFHYGTDNGDTMDLWSLPAGQTTGPALIGTVGLLTRYRFDADGTLQFALDDTCDDFAAYSWMGDWYLYSDGNQIYRGPRLPGPAGACGDEGQPLLPETNTARVADPVGSPDLREVAFTYTNADDTRSIYVMPADGSGQPRKIDNVEWPNESAHLVGWV